MTQEEMKKLNKSMKQNVQVSVDYITNYAERYTGDKEFAKNADTVGLTMLLIHAITLVESYMELAEKYKKQVATKEVKAEERRILKLLYESDWFKHSEEEEPLYWFEFDTEDRELTHQALSELIRCSAEPEKFKGKQVGYVLMDGYVIEENNHCTLSVINAKPQKCALVSWLKYEFEGKKK